MNFNISITEEGNTIDAIKDGCIIISRGEGVNFKVEDLTFQFNFSDPMPDGEKIKTEVIDENGSESKKYMKITIQVERNELNSLFCPPVVIGTLTKADETDPHKLYMSFNARSLDGPTSHCIMLNYSFFLSR